MNIQQNIPPLQQPKLRQTWYGPEQLCSKCGEYWPADPEFFYRSKTGLRGVCKACYAEQEALRRRGGEA